MVGEQPYKNRDMVARAQAWGVLLVILNSNYFWVLYTKRLVIKVLKISWYFQKILQTFFVCSKAKGVLLKKFNSVMTFVDFRSNLALFSNESHNNFFFLEKCSILHISLLFLYPPSSGIASCVGTAGRAHDSYTWHGPAMYL